MKPIITCELQYFSSPHLSQIYDGFQKLSKAGIIELLIKPATGDFTKPLLKAVINRKYTVIYDTLDGLNWVDGITSEENLNYFKNNIQVDFYFKRSCNKKVFEHAPVNCKVYPLGLNYSFKPEGKFPVGTKEMIVDLLKDNYIISNFYNRSAFSSKDFEHYPVSVEEGKILFLARLWNPNDVNTEQLKNERELINKNRVECIRACRKEFGEKFIGGLQDDSFSRQYAKDLIVPFALTKRESFLKAIKESDVCISTTGLHDSIGWKFGEYVSASRAIVSEPLAYELPGNFSENKNYLIYSNGNELVGKISELLGNKAMLFEMMNNNFQYYNNYLRPDVLVLNTLLKVIQHAEKQMNNKL